MNNNQHRVMYRGRSWGKAQYYKAAREMAEKAMQSSPARGGDDITEVAIDECKEVTEEDCEKVKEWAEKMQGKSSQEPLAKA